MRTLCIVKTNASLKEVRAALSGLKVTIFDDAHRIGIPDPDYQVGVVWSIEDVIEVRPDLNEGQAMNVLRQVLDDHDAEIGVNWDVLQQTADAMYGPKPGDCDNYMLEE